MKKGCELCGGAARMHCESDQASLCWDCDEKVHGANFLVAKHCRSLLCQVCQSPTPWKASGSKLGPTVSICESCFSVHNSKNGEDREESHVGNDEGGGNEYEEFDGDDDDDDDVSDGYDDDDDDEEDDHEEEEEDGDNQVVPWSSTTALSPAPPVASSSSSEEEISSRFSGEGRILKRMRGHNTDLDSDDEIGSFSSGPCERTGNEEGSSCGGGFRRLKQARKGEVEDDDGQDESRSTSVVDSLRRLQRDMVNDGQDASATILGICRLSRDESR